MKWNLSNVVSIRKNTCIDPAEIKSVLSRISWMGLQPIFPCERLHCWDCILLTNKIYCVDLKTLLTLLAHPIKPQTKRCNSQVTLSICLKKNLVLCCRCVHITDIGVGYISTMLSLSALFLRWCSQVRDFGLNHLCGMRNIQVLSLAG